MSLFNAKQKIEIPLYYQEKKTKAGFSKVVVLEDEKAKELMQEEKDAEAKAKTAGKEVDKSIPKVQVLNTTWKVLLWKEQNSVTKNSMFYNKQEGYQDIDVFEFRDRNLKECLISWDLKDEFGQPVDLNSSSIDLLPADVVLALMQKYEDITTLTPDEEKN